MSLLVVKSIEVSLLVMKSIEVRSEAVHLASIKSSNSTGRSIRRRGGSITATAVTGSRMWLWNEEKRVEQREKRVAWIERATSRPSAPVQSDWSFCLAEFGAS